MISVVLPDTGPLISFARIKRLDLFDRFKTQILITDAVHFEIMDEWNPSADKAEISSWMQSNRNKIQIVETTYGSLIQANRELLMSYPEEKQPEMKRKTRVKDAGELAIYEMVNKLRPQLSSEATALVIFEDRTVEKMSFGPYARIISTWSFVRLLETLNVIESAEKLYDAIEETGRFPSKRPFDFFDPAQEDFVKSYDISTSEQHRQSESFNDLAL